MRNCKVPPGSGCPRACPELVEGFAPYSGANPSTGSGQATSTGSGQALGRETFFRIPSVPHLVIPTLNKVKGRNLLRLQSRQRTVPATISALQLTGF